MATSSIASRWREFSGEYNWDGLLDSLDVDLRRHIIHYLQRAGAGGDAFNENKASKGYGLSLYPPEEYFARIGLEIGNPYKYRVTNFIYSATYDNKTAYIGYVAVATDEGKIALGRRDILVSWRGTMTDAEWAADANLIQTSAKDLFGTGLAQVHAGFYGIYTRSVANSVYTTTSAREQVLKAVRELVDKYQDEEVSITVTGYSLGAALATLNAMDIAHNGFNKPTNHPNKAFMVSAFPAASPRVGNLVFREVFDNLKNFHLLRIVNATDPVPKLPYAPLIYAHVGQELGIDTTKSPYLKKKDVNPHMLEIYQHGIAGVQANGEFELVEELHFDNTVVNKYTDGLLDEYNIPDHWYTKELFKNMVQMPDGHWKFDDSAYVPDPPTV